jgi:hypothetical protein
MYGLHSHCIEIEKCIETLFMDRGNNLMTPPTPLKQEK